MWAGCAAGQSETMGAPVVRVENHSSEQLYEIDISASRFSHRIERLTPRESACVRLSGVQGESSLEFHVNNSTVRIEANDLDYLEASGRARRGRIGSSARNRAG